MQRKFALGRLLATPGAVEAFKEAQESPLEYIARHASGDWGSLSKEDVHANEVAVAYGDIRVLSAYRLKNRTKIWVVTEADRSSTCVLLPSEY